MSTVFTINGETAYTKAFLIWGPILNEKGRIAFIRERLETGRGKARVLNAQRTGRAYPVELAPVLKETAPFPTDRPLWMFHVGETVVLASPEKPATKMEEALPLLLGENPQCIDLKEAKERMVARVETIAVFDSIRGKPYPSTPLVPATELTLWQTAQLLSLTEGKVPQELQLEFCSLDRDAIQLFGHLSWESAGSGSTYRLCLPLCNNLDRISYPFERDDFKKVKFAENCALYDTAFEVDSRLIGAFKTRPAGGSGPAKPQIHRHFTGF